MSASGGNALLRLYLLCILKPCAMYGAVKGGLVCFVQRLGFYDPLKKETNLNAPAIKKWLDVGALPSDTVRDLLKRAMVIE